MQPGFQVLYCICKLQSNGIAYYVLGELRNIHKFEYVSKPVYSWIDKLTQAAH